MRSTCTASVELVFSVSKRPKTKNARATNRMRAVFLADEWIAILACQQVGDGLSPAIRIMICARIFAQLSSGNSGITTRTEVRVPAAKYVNSLCGRIARTIDITDRRFAVLRQNGKYAQQDYGREFGGPFASIHCAGRDLLRCSCGGTCRGLHVCAIIKCNVWVSRHTFFHCRIERRYIRCLRATRLCLDLKCPST